MHLRRFARKLEDESGQVIVLTVLCLAVLIGVVALAVNVGQLLSQRRQMQTAADSAALAGAEELSNGDVTSAAQADAAQNGFPASATTVNVGPSNGPNKAKSGYVEVIVSVSEPTYFMRIFGKNSMTVSARAVATTALTTTCLYALNSSGTDISLTGSGSLSIPSCGIIDDSSDSQALKFTGSGSISADSIKIVGGYKKTGSGSISPTPTTGISPVDDPLADMTPPSYAPGACNAALSYTGSKTNAVPGPSTPGGVICYKGFSNKGSGSVTFPPGVYVFTGDFTNSGSGSISGSGVTFYMAAGGGSFSVNGSGPLNLSAPTSGPYSGILFYQDPGNTQGMSFNGSSSTTLSGIFYMPTSTLSFTGSGGSTFNTDMVVGALTLTGSGTFHNYDPIGGGSPLSTARLVE
ncbi:MAG TPA: pilus assembly protein TadG-related protein [Acidobacteriaceae bacterium]|nr:pilus assembly protein TadG-related protein [Acidobacteriaceae bacterium]